MTLENLTKELESLILKRNQEGADVEGLNAEIDNLEKKIKAFKYEAEFGL